VILDLGVLILRLVVLKQLRMMVYLRGASASLLALRSVLILNLGIGSKLIVL
jgi:hypothetical protein